jgi:hypothetical protein
MACCGVALDSVEGNATTARYVAVGFARQDGPIHFLSFWVRADGTSSRHGNNQSCSGQKVFLIEPTGDIKVGLKVWMYWGHLRELWKEFRRSSEQILDLQQRVADLEKKLQRCPGEACPHCGALAFRVVNSQPDPNVPSVLIRQMKCQECDFEERRVFQPPGSPRV